MKRETLESHSSWSFSHEWNMNGKKGFWRVCWSHSVCLQGRDIILLGDRSTVSKDTVQLLVSAEPAFCARDSGQQGRITGVWFTVWDTLSWILDYTFKQLIRNLNHNSCFFQREEAEIMFSERIVFLPSASYWLVKLLVPPTNSCSCLSWCWNDQCFITDW